MSNKREELINGNIFHLMLKLGIPGILGMLIISLYSFADAAFVGQYAENGSIALGAISTAYTFTLINNGIAVLIGVGSASVLSRAIGRKDQKTIDSIMDNVFILSITLSFLTTILGIALAPHLLTLIKVEGEMHVLATKYLRLVFLSSIFVNFGQASNMVLRGEGKITIAMIIMSLGAILNIILDAIFVIIFKQGLEGAAIATIISQVIFGLASFFYILLANKSVTFHKFTLEKSIVKETFSIGVTAMLMQILALIQQAVMYSTLKKYGGENEVILMGGFFRYMMLSFIPLWGLSQGFQPFIGTNFGAGLFDRVKKGTFYFYAFGILIAIIAWAIFIANPQAVLSMFIKEKELVAKGSFNALVAFSIYPLVPMLILNITLFQSLGKAKAAGILTIGRQFFFFVPICIILSMFIGSSGVWFAMPITDGFTFLLSLVLVVGAFNKDLKK